MSYGIRKEFYNSKLWKEVKNNIWIKQHLLCNRCGKPVYVDGISEWIPKDKRRTGIVHHKIYLNNTNIYDDNITINEDNLEGVCKWCHEHVCHNTDTSIRKDYEFDDEGNIKPRE